MRLLKMPLVLIAAATLGACTTVSDSTLISVPDSARLTWQEVPGTEGAVSYANVEGDIFGKGPYQAYVRFRKGTDNGLHVHSQTLPTVVLSGTFYAVIDGKRTEYPAGAFYRLPARLVHKSGCTAAADCLLFQYQADSFDLVPAKG